MVNHNPKVLLDPPEMILGKIEIEIQNKNWIYALFLEASAIEGYLNSLIALSGTTILKKASKNFLDKMSFISLVNMNNILGNINDTLYKKLTKFGDQRNVFAHYLIGIDFKDPKVNDEARGLISEGLKLCQELADIQTNKLNLRTSK